ncbi:hypothetical protein ABIE48_003049 [Paenibacillus sp. OAE614]
MFRKFSHNNGRKIHQADFYAHVRDEYSTFGWILEGMLKNTGFPLASVEYSGDTLGKNLLSGSAVNKKIKVIGIVYNDHNDHFGGVSHHEQKFSAIVWGRRQ